MNFTGLTYRYFAAIESGTFVFENIKTSAVEIFNDDTPSGQEFRIGLTGTPNEKSWFFSFKNGKIYDPEGRWFGAYDETDINTISGTFSSSEYNYYFNDELICAKGVRSDVINGWYAQCISGATAEGTVKIYTAEVPTSLTMSPTFYLSGLWTGLFTNNSNNTILLRTGILFLPDASKFYITGGCFDFSGGNNILETLESVNVNILHTGNTELTGVFNLGVRVYGDFGYKDFYATGTGLNSINTFVGNSFSPTAEQTIYVANSGETGTYTWYFSTNYLDVSQVSQSKGFYAEIAYESGLTGLMSHLTGINITNQGSYTEAPIIYVGPITGGFPYASGTALLDGTSITGVEWTNANLGYYYGETGGYTVSTQGGAGSSFAATPLFGEQYLKTVSGLFDFYTGAYEYGNSGALCSEVYNRISGIGTLDENHNVLMMKVNYIGMPDTAQLKIKVKATGMQDTTTLLTTYSGYCLAYTT